MAGITHLREIYERKGEEFIKDLLSKYVIISEKLDGSAFSLKRENGVLTYYKKDEPITYMHRVLSKFYEPAIIHIENQLAKLNESNIELPDNLVIGFEYFPGRDKPLNNILVLSYINRTDGAGNVTKAVHSRDVLENWAKAFSVAEPPILFQGTLNEDQKQSVLDFVYTPYDDLSTKFKSTSFTKYIVKALSPDKFALFESSNKQFESVVFRFYENENADASTYYVTKLIDPAITTQLLPAKAPAAKKSDDYVWLIVSDIMNYIETISYPDLKSAKAEGQSYEERYVNLINEIYKKFISEFGNKYREIKIDTPEYLKKNEFDINTGLIKDVDIISLINQNQTFKEIYKIMLNVFRKKKEKVSSTFFSSSMVSHLNSQIDKIQKALTNESIFEDYFPTFGEYIGGVSDASYFAQFDAPKDRHKSTMVNLLVADFQPIHNGNVESARSLNAKNGEPVVLIGIAPDQPNAKYPIPSKVIEEMLRAIVKSNPGVIIDARVVKKGTMNDILQAIKPNYEPITLASAPGRLKDYALQLEHARRKTSGINLRTDFKLLETPNFEITQKIKDSIKSNNYAEFKQLAPKSIHSFFINLTACFNNATSVKEHLKYDETEINPTINFLIDLKGKEKSDAVDGLLENFTKVLSIFNSDSVISEIKEEITKRGYSITVANELLSNINKRKLEESDLESFKNFLKENKGIEVKLDETKVFDLTDIQLNEKIVDEIVHYQEPGQGKGLGEAIGLLFKDGSKAKIGDIMINESLIEVKKDKGRLFSAKKNGDSQFISGKEVLLSQLNEMMDRVNADIAVTTFISGIGENGLNINIENMKNWMKLRTMFESRGVDLKEFSTWFSNMFANKLFKMPELQPLIFEKAFDAFDSSVLVEEDSRELINSILYCNFKYYAKIDGFKGMVGIGTRLKNNNSIVYIPESISYSDFKKFISADSGLSWTDTRHASFRIHINQQQVTPR